MNFFKITGFAIFTFGLGVAHASTSYEYIYGQGDTQDASKACGPAQVQSQAPHFVASEGVNQKILNQSLAATLILGQGAPVPRIGADSTNIQGSLWQLEVNQVTSHRPRTAPVTSNNYVFFECNGHKYFSFKVFMKGNPNPLFRIAVSEDDTSIFRNATAVSDSKAMAMILLSEPAPAQKPTKTAAAPVVKPAVTAPATTPAPIVKATPAASSVPAPAPVKVATVTPAPATPSVQFKVLDPSTIPLPRPRPASAPKTAAAPTPPPPPDPDIADYDKAAPWHGNKHASIDWTQTTLNAIRAQWQVLSSAEDITDFCPGYHGKDVTKKTQEICWIRIIGALAQLETGFIPTEVVHEDDGSWSVGLLQLSPTQCPNAPTIAALKKALPNLTCGVNEIALWLKKGKSLSAAGGPAAIWSTLRDPYWATLGGKPVHVGKKAVVEQIAKVYTHFE